MDNVFTDQWIEWWFVVLFFKTKQNKNINLNMKQIKFVDISEMEIENNLEPELQRKL